MEGYNVNFSAGTADDRRRSNRLGSLLGVLILALVGFVFFIVATFMDAKLDDARERATEKTTAVVTEMREHEDADDDISFTPVFTFVVNDELHSVASDYSNSKPRHSVGDEVEIYYAPDDPDTIYEPDSADSQQLVINVFRVIGIIMAVIGVAILVIGIAQNTKRRSRDELEDYY